MGALPRNQMNRVAEKIISARYCYLIWWTLKERESRQRYYSVLNDYPVFFRYVIYSSFKCCIMDISSCFDKSKRSVSIPNIFQKLEGSLGDSASILRLKGLLGDLEDRFKKIKTLRNKIYAHTDNRHPSLYFEDVSITGNYIRDFILDTGSFFNEIEVIDGVIPMDWPADSDVDLNRLLETNLRHEIT